MSSSRNAVSPTSGYSARILSRRSSSRRSFNPSKMPITDVSACPTDDFRSSSDISGNFIGTVPDNSIIISRFPFWGTRRIGCCRSENGAFSSIMAAKDRYPAREPASSFQGFRRSRMAAGDRCREPPPPRNPPHTDMALAIQLSYSARKSSCPLLRFRRYFCKWLFTRSLVRDGS